MSKCPKCGSELNVQLFDRRGMREFCNCGFEEIYPVMFELYRDGDVKTWDV